MAVLSQIKASDNVTYNIRDDYSTWGGRNLLIGAGYYTKSSPYSYTSTAKDGYVYLPTMLTSEPLVSGQQYVIQAKTNGTWAASHGSQATTNVTLWLVTGTNVSTNSYHYNFNTASSGYLGDGKWVWTCPSDSNGLYGHIRVNNYNTDGTTSVTHTYWNFKLEKGNKATDWSPAPEDIARFIGNETIELYG